MTLLLAQACTSRSQASTAVCATWWVPRGQSRNPCDHTRLSDEGVGNFDHLRGSQVPIPPDKSHRGSFDEDGHD